MAVNGADDTLGRGEMETEEVGVYMCACVLGTETFGLLNPATPIH